MKESSDVWSSKSVWWQKWQIFQTDYHAKIGIWKYAINLSWQNLVVEIKILKMVMQSFVECRCCGPIRTPETQVLGIHMEENEWLPLNMFKWMGALDLKKAKQKTCKEAWKRIHNVNFNTFVIGICIYLCTQPRLESGHSFEQYQLLCYNLKKRWWWYFLNVKLLCKFTFIWNYIFYGLFFWFFKLKLIWV